MGPLCGGTNRSRRLVLRSHKTNKLTIKPVFFPQGTVFFKDSGELLIDLLAEKSSRAIMSECPLVREAESGSVEKCQCNIIFNYKLTPTYVRVSVCVRVCYSNTELITLYGN